MSFVIWSFSDSVLSSFSKGFFECVSCCHTFSLFLSSSVFSWNLKAIIGLYVHSVMFMLMLKCEYVLWSLLCTIQYSSVALYLLLCVVFDGVLFLWCGYCSSFMPLKNTQYTKESLYTVHIKSFCVINTGENLDRISSKNWWDTAATSRKNFILDFSNHNYKKMKLQ